MKTKMMNCSSNAKNIPAQSEVWDRSQEDWCRWVQVGACQLSEGAFCLLRDRPRGDLSNSVPADEAPLKSLLEKMISATGVVLRAL